MEKWQLRETLDRWRDELIGCTTPAGHWTGHLAASALSTATAVSALSALRIDRAPTPRSAPAAARLEPCIRRGANYLRGCQNADGGFGDTDRSRSNIAATLLVLAAWRLAAEADSQSGTAADEAAAQRAEAYVQAAGGWAALRARYGRDKTFVVPILTNCAIAGMIDWSEVPRLPFEAAVFPQSMYRFLQMPVVSYAIPALVAIGQARHFLGPPAPLPIRLVRQTAVERTMRVLRQMQPCSGGFLEATPLTSFVLMSLAATGRGDGAVAEHCSRFLIDSMATDGSWPIDTNLAAWVTSLAIHALRTDPADDARWVKPALVDWQLGCQHTRRHPFTGADPGGWGWTDLSGAVPDGDDTPAAILALASLRPTLDAVDAEPTADGQLGPRIDRAIGQGQRWLLELQNRDGGWPTFCRGWGKLPFDRSSVDLTAHALRALQVAVRGQHDAAWGAPRPSPHRVEAACDAGWDYLRRQQRDDGSWVPLWFGNHDRPADENPVYGTGRVLLALGHLDPPEAGCRRAAARGADFLVGNQNPDGGWGGGATLTDWLRQQGLPAEDPQLGVPITSSVEETAVAVEGLAAWLVRPTLRDPPPGQAAHGGPLSIRQDAAVGGDEAYRAAILRGVRFLDRAIQTGRHRVPWPIGFYFAKLWYHERLYPAVFATAALAQTWTTLFAEPETVASATGAIAADRS